MMKVEDLTLEDMERFVPYALGFLAGAGVSIIARATISQLGPFEGDRRRGDGGVTEGYKDGQWWEVAQTDPKGVKTDPAFEDWAMNDPAAQAQAQAAYDQGTNEQGQPNESIFNRR